MEAERKEAQMKSLIRCYWVLGGPEMSGYAQDYFLGLIEQALIEAHLAARRRPGRPQKGGAE
ncbi:MAG: hypothetical protein DRN14_05275 [Thermoplasmata archaeon]|nr:MAG: hypothetical protein DRN14_05275 [Thermoplasmata archaeon]